MKKLGLILVLFAFTASFTVASTTLTNTTIEIALDQDGGKDKKKKGDKKDCAKKTSCTNSKKACCAKKAESKEGGAVKEEAKETK